MNTSNLIYPSLIIGTILLLALPMIPDNKHDHRFHEIEMNRVKSTYITVCIVKGDTVAQVAFPNTKMKKHIDYDSK